MVEMELEVGETALLEAGREARVLGGRVMTASDGPRPPRTPPPSGRSREKEKQLPPPVCWISAASRSVWKRAAPKPA